MKLSPRDAAGYFKRPDPSKAGLLIYGSDPMRVALRRKDVLLAMVGDAAEEEMRLTRFAGSDLRSDPAAVVDAMKAQGFFPGARAIHVEGANEQSVTALTAALEDWQEGDAAVVVTAGQLGKASKLRALFEGAPNAYAAAIYDDPPSRGEIEEQLARAGVRAVDPDAMNALVDLSRLLEMGDLRQTIEKLGLFKYKDDTPASVADIEAVSPQSYEAELDDMIDIVAEGRTEELGPMMARLSAQGTLPVTLCIGTTRHFRRLHVAASDPGGPGSGIGKLRPPVFGPRRDRMQRQASAWGRIKLERALSLLTETDLTLRSSAKAPTLAVMERALIRLAMMAQR